MKLNSGIISVLRRLKFANFCNANSFGKHGGEIRAESLAEVHDIVLALWQAGHQVTVVTSNGVTFETYRDNPMGDMSCVIYGPGPLTGKTGWPALSKQLVKNTQLHKQRLGLGIISNLSNVVRRGFKWCHGTKQTTGESLN